MHIEKRLQELNIHLPPTPEPAAMYIPAVRSSDLVFISGQTPKKGNELLYKGKLGAELTLQQGSKAANICLLRCLSALRSVLDDLDRVEKIVKLTGYVNSIDTFTGHSQVLNSASDLLEMIFGEKGQHTRSVIGVNALPGNAAVELELVVKICNE